MSASAEVAATPNLRRYRLPQLVIARFVTRRTIKSAVFWAAVYGMYVASKAIGYAVAYPTVQSREVIIQSLGNNAGLTALLGRPYHLESVAGYTAWNTMAIITLVGSVWALLLATRTFRGEETAGRWELLLGGQTTMRRAAANALAGLFTCLAVLWAVSALAFILVGKVHSVQFSAPAALYLALCTIMGAAMFAALGALTSQLMPTRARAATLATGIFGLSFLVRAAGDGSSAHWLSNVSPLGWIQQLQPLYAPQPLWLVPCLTFIVSCAGLAIFLAGKRDVGDSFIKDKDTARSHLRLLNSPLGLAVRLIRGNTLGWTLTLVGMSTFYGLLTKTVVSAFEQSQGAANVLQKFTSTHTTVATAFLSSIFLILMVVIMCYGAAAAGNIREQEAEGYLDNLLVRKVARLQWLWGRVGLAGGIIAGMAMLSGIATWASQASQGLGIPFHSMLIAGVNIIAPGLFTLGVAVLGFGVAPRFTTLIGYSVVAWSFLIEMIRSGVNLNHWLLDTSVLHHIALAPATNPNWTSAAVLTLLGLAAALVGSLRFRNRDLQNE
ncbi:MAG TPA: ABC transporter permease subunit [Candidatus Saccharimonadales bacterium]